jgi:hypothetical protein
MDSAKALARRRDSGTTPPPDRGGAEAIDVYVESFPNIARDRNVWPIIERAIRRRFQNRPYVSDFWKFACARNAADGRTPGSIPSIVRIYDGLEEDAEGSRRSKIPSLPAHPEPPDGKVKKLLALLTKKIGGKITKSQFEREAERLSQGG